MQTYDAVRILKQIIELFLSNLEELTNDATDTNDFIEGEKTAYVECLEIIQRWKCAAEFGLDFDIEKKFPLI